MEPLESRRLPSGLFTVTKSVDDGSSGTLAWAINQSNATPVDSPSSPNVIDFSGPLHIVLQGQLPAITRPVIIDGYSAGGSTNNQEAGDNAVIPIQVDGSKITGTPAAEGLIIAAYNCTVDGLSITGFGGSGIDIEPPSASPPTTGAIGANLWGDWIGVAPDGTTPGNGGAGIIVACSNNAIGGTLPVGRNLIEDSGEAGVVLCGPGGAGNLVQDSFILNNSGDGVLALSANNLIGQPIGSLTAGAGDVISGNTLDGVLIRGPSAQGNVVDNDLIGTTPDGLSGMPNKGDGVRIEDAPGNVVGGTAADTLDVIAGSVGEGVLIENDQGDALPAVPQPVSDILQQDNISINSPADRATANRVEGSRIGYNVTATNTLMLLPNTDGVFIASSGNTVGGTSTTARNVIIANARNGVVIAGDSLTSTNSPDAALLNADPTDNVVAGNFIGTQGGGDDYGNTLEGILLLSAAGNTIGGTVGATAAGTIGASANVISGNNDGIVIAASGLDATPGGQNLIEGNLIGTTADSLDPLPNAIDGIRIDDVPGNTVGGITSASANVISGNEVGLHILDPGATGNAAWGNFIGSDITGTLPVRNAGYGVLIERGASGNSIGGTGSGEGNTIAFNTDDGVRVVSGVGPTPTRDDPILTNAIFSNGPLGIALVGGANDGLGAPTVADALPDKALAATQIDGSYSGQAGAIYLVQFFSTPGVIPSGRVEGRTFIGSTIVKMTAQGGQVAFSVDVPTVVASGDWVTATATLMAVDPVSGATTGETSPISSPPVAAISPFLVTSTADVSSLPALGTLRYAIQFSNAHPSPSAAAPNTIDFQISGTGLQTIGLVSTLTVTQPVVIDGYSQPGASVNDSRQLLAPDTIDDQETDIASALVQLDGSRVPGAGAIGLDVQAPGCTVDGLVLTGFAGAAIFLEPSSSQTTGAIGDTVWGNFLGVTQFSPRTFDPIQPSANSNANGVGVLIDGPNNLVGGTVPWDRNVIQGNRNGGVVLFGAQGTGNAIDGNFILDNGGDGVLVLSSGNHIGQASGPGLAGAGNLISGNQGNGVHIMDPSARGNTVANDEIGTQVGLAGLWVPILGTQPRPNGLSGVLIEDAPANTIGGLVPGSADVIAGNILDGITIENAAGGAIPAIASSPPSPSPYNDGLRNVVEGNLIGLNQRNGGVETIPNQEDGVDVSSSGNTIGGASSAAQNIIASNRRNAIAITGIALDSSDRPDPTGLIAFPQPVANLIQGNFIGTVGGNDDYGNAFDGILLDQAGGNSVGGTASGAGNVVSNNGAGIVIAGSLSSANVIEGNMVGTSSTGTAPLGNATDGIAIVDASANIIGGTSAAAANVVAGNTDGIHLSGPGAIVNLIEGDDIGTNSDGASQLGNSLDGVLIDDNASSNTIGGTAAGAGNVIAHNGGSGVHLLSGVGNTILSDSLASNDATGIVLAGAANHGQAAPTITSATPLTTSTMVSGTLASTPATTFLIQVFSGTTADIAGSYEGQALVGSTTITTDATGQATFGLALPASIPFGAAITATATSLATGDTSAFSGAALNAPLIEFGATQYYVSQPAASAVITIARNTGVGSSTVVYSAGPGTAVAGVDFTSVTAAVSFAPGQTTATFSVPILAAPNRVGDYTVNLTLSHPTGAGLGAPSSAVLTITSSPGTLSFKDSTVSVSPAVGGVVIAVERARGASGTVTVTYAASPVDAIPGVDYVPVSGTLTFPPGATEATFALPVLADSPNPDDATIALTLGAPTGGAAIGSPATELVTIDKPLILTSQHLEAGRRGITSVTLTFNKPLDPAQAVNLANFGEFVYWSSPGGAFPDGGRTTPLSSASYNPADRSVTLIPSSALRLGRFYRIRVDENAHAVLGNGLTDTSGGVLAGSDGVPGSPYLVTFGAGPRLTYADGRGNDVTLRLQRGGILSLFQAPGGGVQQIGLIGADPGRSTLTGTVTRGAGGTGRTAIPPIAGAGGVRIRLDARPFGVSRAASLARPFAWRAWHHRSDGPIMR